MKKEHGFLKVICGFLIIALLAVLGTFITKTATGGYVGGAIGALIAFYIFIIKKAPEAKEDTTDKTDGN